MKRLLFLLTMVSTMLVVCNGCAGYQRGSSVPKNLRTVHVPSFTNNTSYPMVGAMAAQQFLDALIEDGTFTPTNHDDAAVRTRVEIISLSLSSVRYDRNNRIVPDEYHLRIMATLYAYRSDTGEVLIPGRLVSAHDSAMTRSDVQNGVMDSLPRLTRLLANNLLEELQTIQLPDAPQMAVPAEVPQAEVLVEELPVEEAVEEPQADELVEEPQPIQ